MITAFSVDAEASTISSCINKLGPHNATSLGSEPAESYTWATKTAGLLEKNALIFMHYLRFCNSVWNGIKIFNWLQITWKEKSRPFLSVEISHFGCSYLSGSTKSFSRSNKAKFNYKHALSCFWAGTITRLIRIIKIFASAALGWLIC